MSEVPQYRPEEYLKNKTDPKLSKEKAWKRRGYEIERKLSKSLTIVSGEFKPDSRVELENDNVRVVVQLVELSEDDIKIVIDGLRDAKYPTDGIAAELIATSFKIEDFVITSKHNDQKLQKSELELDFTQIFYVPLMHRALKRGTFYGDNGIDQAIVFLDHAPDNAFTIIRMMHELGHAYIFEAMPFDPELKMLHNEGRSRISSIWSPLLFKKEDDYSLELVLQEERRAWAFAIHLLKDLGLFEYDEIKAMVHGSDLHSYVRGIQLEKEGFGPKLWQAIKDTIRRYYKYKFQK